MNFYLFDNFRIIKVIAEEKRRYEGVSEFEVFEALIEADGSI